MNTKEAMEALLAGKKIKHSCWALAGAYIYLNKNGDLVDQQNCGATMSLGLLGYEIYEEPKPVVMRAQYMVKCPGFSPRITRYLYVDDDEFKNSNPAKYEWFKRLEEVECES